MQFLDGPAEGIRLLLNRAPLYLRIVFDGQEWDGLDQPDDRPRPTERIYAYRQVAHNGSGFWDGVDKRGRRVGGRLHLADYRVIDPQPDEGTMRDNEKWRAWTQAQHAASKEAATHDQSAT